MTAFMGEIKTSNTKACAVEGLFHGNSCSILHVQTMMAPVD